MSTGTGQKNRYVTLQSPNSSTNDFGENIPGKEWDTIAEVWATVEPTSGQEFEIANQQNATTVHKITIRNMIGITDSIKLTWRFLDPSRNVAFNVMQRLVDSYTQDGDITLICIQDEQFTA